MCKPSKTPPNPLHQLSASAYRFVVHQLYQNLPPPFGTDPEHTALVIEAAIARIVTADAQASDCIRTPPLPSREGEGAPPHRSSKQE
jgi:hypothetical protein